MTDVARTTISHGEDESYFVSMTDLMVGMLFVFIIILMAFALNLQKQATDLGETVDDLTAARETRAAMLQDIKRSLELQGVTVDVDEDNGILRLPEKLLFQRGEYRIQPAGEDALRHLANVLAGILPCFASLDGEAPPQTCPATKGGRLEAVFIEGHTDDIPMKAYAGAKIASNWELSAARAITVYDTLLGVQPALASIRNDGTAQRSGQRLVGVSGYGEHRPAVANADEASRALNRRIDLRFLMATPSRDALGAIDGSIPSRSDRVAP
jgi:flagellar motor protein MotB